MRAATEELLARVPDARQHLLVNADIELARELGIGVHLRASQLRDLRERPLPATQWVGASCHDTGELERAATAPSVQIVRPLLSSEPHDSSHRRS